MRKNRSPVLAFHLLAAALSRKISDMRGFEGCTYTGNFYYSSAKGQNQIPTECIYGGEKREREGRVWE